MGTFIYHMKDRNLERFVLKVETSLKIRSLNLALLEPKENLNMRGICHFLEGYTSTRDLVQNPQSFGFCFARIFPAEEVE